MRTRHRRWIPPPGDRETGFGVPCCGGSSVSRGEPGLQRGPPAPGTALAAGPGAPRGLPGHGPGGVSAGSATAPPGVAGHLFGLSRSCPPDRSSLGCCRR